MTVDNHVLICGIRGVGKKKLASSFADSTRKVKKYSRFEWIDLEDPRLSPGPRLETIDLFVKAGNRLSDTLLVVEEIGALSSWPKFISKIDRYSGIKFIMTISGNPDHIKRKIGNTQIDIVELLPPGFGAFYKLREMPGKLDDLCDEYLSKFSHVGDELIDLLHEIIFMDVIMKHEIRDVKKLTDMAVYMIESSGSCVSANSLKKHLLGSLDKTRAFLRYLEESGLIFLIDRIEDAERERKEAARLCVAGDIRLVPRLSRGPVDKRRLAVTTVYHELRRLSLVVYSWRMDGRDGFLVRKNAGGIFAIDVAWDEEPEAIRRISRVMARYGASEGLLLCRGPEAKEVKSRRGSVHIRSLAGWLLAPGLELEPVTPSVPVRVEDLPADEEPQSSLPSHLL